MNYLQNQQLPIKRVADSAKEELLQISWQDCHPHEVFFGSLILQKSLEVAKRVAVKHAETEIEAKGIDFVRFFAPIRREDRLYCLASVNYTFDSSLEVGIKVIAEDFRLLEKRKILRAYFIFTSVNKEKVFSIQPITEEEKGRFLKAQKRQKIREAGKL